jgi:hypothetical protein
MIEGAMKNHKVTDDPSVEEILEAEKEAYDFIRSNWG